MNKAWEKALKQALEARNGIIYLDLDGTTLPDEGTEVSAEVLAALKALSEKYLILPVTGRKADRSDEVMEQLHGIIGHGLCFIDGGSRLAQFGYSDETSKVEILDEVFLDIGSSFEPIQEIVEKVAGISLQNQSSNPEQVVVEYDDYVLGESEGELPQEACRVCVRFISKEEADDIVDEISKLQGFAAVAIEDLNGRARAEVEAEGPIPWQVQIFNPHGNKGGVVRRVCEALEIDATKCFAFGNSGNDFDMMVVPGINVRLVNTAGKDFVERLVTEKVRVELSALIAGVRKIAAGSQRQSVTVPFELSDLKGEQREALASAVANEVLRTADGAIAGLIDETSTVVASLAEQGIQIDEAELGVILHHLKYQIRLIGPPAEAGVARVSQSAFAFTAVVEGRGDRTVYEALITQTNFSSPFSDRTGLIR